MIVKKICALFIVLMRLTTGSGYLYDEEKQPTYLTAAVGQYIIFNCDIDFPQSIAIPYMLNWKKEGKIIFSWYDGVSTASEPYQGRISLLSEPFGKYGKASINLTAIREDDAGWFECKVLFPNRTPTSRNNGTWFYLTVNGGNVLAIPPVNQTTMEGDKAEITCVTKDRDTNVTWYKDGILLKELPDILKRSWVTEDGSLTIHPTTMSDLGEYECEAVNVRGEKQSARAFLNVQYKAKVIYAPREIYLPYGRSAILDCHFRANPTLTNLRWEKDGFLFDPYNVQGVFYRRNGSLYFSKVDESHAGYYSCTPYNALGTAGPSPKIHVIVQRPPIFIMTPHNLYLRKLGETLEMPCDARDDDNGHKPIIVWYKLYFTFKGFMIDPPNNQNFKTEFRSGILEILGKDGSSLPVGRYSIRNGNLTIINIQEEDKGLYQCSATNEAATVTAETELLVESVPPNAPYNLTATSSYNSVHLTWAAGKKRSHVEYSIWYRPLDTTEWRTVKVESKKTLEATVNNLSPGREYEFMVLSQNKNGDGLFSKTVRILTKGFHEEADKFKGASFPPVGFPRNVTIHLTSKGYLLTWEPPEYGLESLKIYSVRWFQGPEEYYYGLAETKNTSYLITNLEDGYDYSFQIVAISHDDMEAASEKLTITIPGYKKIKTVSTGIIAGFALIAVAFTVAYYVKRKWCRSYFESNSKQNI